MKPGFDMAAFLGFSLDWLNGHPIRFAVAMAAAFLIVFELCLAVARIAASRKQAQRDRHVRREHAYLQAVVQIADRQARTNGKDAA
jgi:hypothetical protein